MKLKIRKGATATASTFDNLACNGAGCSGGAVAISGYYSVTVNIDQTTFSNSNAGANGGAIFVDDKITADFKLTATSSTFTSNIAQTSGGALYLSNTALTSLTKVGGCTFTGNRATISDGGVIHVRASSTNTITV